MTVSPEYNNNDSHISLVCSRLRDWFIITMFIARHGTAWYRPSVWNIPNISTWAARRAGRYADERPNRPLCDICYLQAVAICYSADSHRCV